MDVKKNIMSTWINTHKIKICNGCQDEYNVKRCNRCQDEINVTINLYIQDKICNGCQDKHDINMNKHALFLTYAMDVKMNIMSRCAIDVKMKIM